MPLLVAGAAGLVLAALFSWAALQLQGLLDPGLPQARMVLFAILFLISLLEIAVMTAGLRQLAPKLARGTLNLFALGYVAFAGLYAILYALLVPDALGIMVLAGMSVLRWLSLLLVPSRE